MLGELFFKDVLVAQDVAICLFKSCIFFSVYTARVSCGSNLNSLLCCSREGI